MDWRRDQFRLEYGLAPADIALMKMDLARNTAFPVVRTVVGAASTSKALLAA